MRDINNTYTYRSFVERAYKDKRIEDFYDKYLGWSSDGSLDFSGGLTMDEAYETAINGWDIGIKAVEPKEIAFRQFGSNYKPSMYGSKVNWSNVISGDPRVYYKGKNKVSTMPRRNVFVYLNYSCNTDAKDGLKYAENLIKSLAVMNGDYDLCVYGVFSSAVQDHGVNFNTFVRLKEYGQNFVLNNFAFAFHPSFYRRLYFRLKECSNYYTSSVGQARYNSQVIKTIREYYTEREEAILMPSLLSNGTSIDENKILTV